VSDPAPTPEEHAAPREDAPPHDPGGTYGPWIVATLLLTATLVATVYAGATNVLGASPASLSELQRGLSFGLPLMAILVAHELGHYLVARYHGVPTSPPYFLPMPWLFIGTMGAVITVPAPVRSRNVMVDFALAGPLAGLAVSLVVLCVGLHDSAVAPLTSPALLEGRSLLYVGLIRLLKGPIPDGMDVFLDPTAFAGWVGLLVTMINLVPCGQLDGGHIAEAVVGRGYRRFSRAVMLGLCAFGVAVGAVGLAGRMLGGAPPDVALEGLADGLPWLLWCGLQALIERFTRRRGSGDDPQTRALLASEPLTRGRRAMVALASLTFVLLFMPWWSKVI
jgi:membrane-associated protease RseP (regulator of RpoE activity)